MKTEHVPRPEKGYILAYVREIYAELPRTKLFHSLAISV